MTAVQHRVEVVASVHERDRPCDAAELGRPDHIAGEARPAADDLVAGLDRDLRERIDDAVGAGAERDLLQANAVPLGEGRPKPVAAPVRIAVQLGRSSRQSLDRLGEGPERPFVRRQLDHAVEAELSLDLLDGLARLIGDEVANRRLEKAVRDLGERGHSRNLVDVERHQHCVEVLLAAAVMAAPQALSAEADAFVELDRRVVVWKDVQLQLADADCPRPLLSLPEQGRSDPAPAMLLGDHEAEVGDVPARWMGVAAEREPAHDAVRRELGDEDGGVVVSAQRAQEPSLLAGCAPDAVGDQPAAGLGGDGLGELDERPGVPRLRLADDDPLSETIPWPPRRGSPAAASVPSGRISTAAAPPK